MPLPKAARAETLDRICADLDVQIGITLLRPKRRRLPGTRLRGIAEASGFRLAEGGRFDWIHEETGAVLYSLQNYRSEPFSAESLRTMSTPGAVFVLDVPRVSDPVRVYDQMKVAAKRHRPIARRNARRRQPPAARRRGAQYDPRAGAETPRRRCAK
jgi:FtsZ-interacting cell division protein ZipA